MSYSEIQRIIPVPKSTLSMWLREIKFSETHTFRIKKKRLQAGLAAVEKRKKERRHEITEIRRSATEDIGQITKREIWLSGLLLYWSCSPMRNINEYRKGVRFSNSNPDLVKFFLKWLIEIGKMDRNDIVFDLFVSEADRQRESFIISNWMRITDFPIKFFSHIYYLKHKTGRKKSPRLSRLGLLQIRVKKSSLLQRQIDGWINGIIKQFLGMSERERQRREELLEN
ncbi:MAG: hypothetical protein Q8R36_01595 [bacterium]|nr:hypothetical protein [bacterium]